MVSVQNLAVEFSAKPLFADVSFVINDTDRIALVGNNGVGKTTLLTIIAGLQQPTRGTIGVPSDTVIGYLPQHMKLNDSRTLIEEVRLAFSKINNLKLRLEQLNATLTATDNYDENKYQRTLDEIAHIDQLLSIYGSDNCEADIEKTLLGLGFVRTDFERPTSEFSGGWRMRVELAKLLLQRPDVLLLDEPTNHLDIESIQWLEAFLKQRNKAVVVVSHDRAFIDNVTNRTIEISCGKIYDYAVSYSQFVELRQERIAQQRRAYDNQQKLIHDTEEFIERFRYKATKAVQVQSRIKQLAKIVPIEIDEVDTSVMNLRFPPAPRSGDYPVIAEGVAKAYGDHQVFAGVEFTIKRGEKVAFVGKNGEGKSTLVKCIMGEIPFDGKLTIGHNVKIGYFAQNQAQLMDENLTVFDTIDRVAVGDIRTRIRDILGAFMFGGEASDKKVKVLSGGERSRLAMIKLLLEPVNLLILDEPTNHLDMRSKDVLKRAIKEFNGTAIVVSHDREFLDGLVEKVYEFGGGHVREHLGGIYDFLRTKQISSLQELEKRQSQPAKPKESAGPSAEAGTDVAPKEQRKLSYAEQRQQEKLLKQGKKRVEQAEAEVASLEAKLADIEAQLSAGATDPQLIESYSATQKALENAMSVWELAVSELERLTP